MLRFQVKKSDAEDENEPMHASLCGFTTQVKQKVPETSGRNSYVI